MSLWSRKAPENPPLDLRHFDGILPVELKDIARRREERFKERSSEAGGGSDSFAVHRRKPPEVRLKARTDTATSRKRWPNPDDVFGSQAMEIAAKPMKPDDSTVDRMRPQPIPCDARGLALSGGGIRSAAVCLGALQALHTHQRMSSIDYLSTVSGGGYIGACLTAAMVNPPGEFPFGQDFFDNHLMSYLRNYSNYLLPRGRTAIRNGAEAAVVILRGLVANCVIVFTVLLGCALLTKLAYGRPDLLLRGSFLIRLVRGIFGNGGPHLENVVTTPFLLTYLSCCLLLVVLVVWAILRSYPSTAHTSSDTSGPVLLTARWVLIGTIIIAFLDLQPILINWVIELHHAFRVPKETASTWLKSITAALAAFSGAVSAFSSALGHFLQTSERTKKTSMWMRRVAAQAAILIAAGVLPLLLWAAYLYLAAALIEGWSWPTHVALTVIDWLPPGRRVCEGRDLVVFCFALFVVGAVISLFFSANGYSLHRFYRDRLCTAFLTPLPAAAGDQPPPATPKLSALKSSIGPYPIINAALNVQGSKEANRRGRNADFFIFTPHFVGSDLTFYTGTSGFAPTSGMEALDPALDLATAMAISGAAVSANMGSNTIRPLSPTLALLNIRLGYWLKNPRFLAMGKTWQRILHYWLKMLSEKFYLLMEILNLLDETSAVVYLTDGGHIENLGLYELLKRGCETIIVIDAEADPELAFPSFLKLERYARIDLGIRIVLPWEEIAQARPLHQTATHHLPVAQPPHCAVGRIFYEDGTEGVLLYVKSSVTGDEKDYILDYRRRNPSFPHESTGDQFFTEEQFEMYRALGFHMVDGFFSGTTPFAYLKASTGHFANAQAAFAAVDTTVPRH